MVVVVVVVAVVVIVVVVRHVTDLVPDRLNLHEY